MEITLPTDNDGFILLQCERCGEYFKITPADLEDDSYLSLFCPMCGLTSDTYVTPDVIELATIMAKNYAINEIYNSFKDAEKKGRNSLIRIKVERRPKQEYESPISAGIDALQIKTFQCCNKKAKIHSLIKMSGCYCPFCGVNDYGN